MNGLSGWEWNREQCSICSEKKSREKQVVLIRSSLEGDRGKSGIARLAWDSAVRHEMRLGNKQRRFRMSNGNGVYS